MTAVRLRCSDVIWQKERLLNILVAQLPCHWRKVAWVDCDILFEDAEWTKAASAALEKWSVIQPFSEAIRLRQHQTSYNGTGEVYESFGSRYCQAPETVVSGNFGLHGHTGFAWAARREVIERLKLYDVSMTGSGDHLMAHAFVGDFDSSCVEFMVGESGPFSRHFSRWAADAYELVGGSVGFTSGRVLHLWHGRTNERRYFLRNQQLQSFAFDPSNDLDLTEEGLWKWASNKPALHRWLRQMFASRNEDGSLLQSVLQLRHVSRL